MSLYKSIKDYIALPKKEKQAIVKEKTKSLTDIVKTHVVDSTAALAVTNPIFGGLEVFAYGMTDEVSITSRISATVLTYLGLGSLMSRGRDYSRKLFKIKDDASEKVQYIHDTAYLMAVNFVMTPAIYAFAGAKPKEILVGTAVATGLCFVNGYLMGLAIDSLRGLTGLKNSERLPKSISNLKSGVKKAIAIGTVAALVGLNVLVYVASPDKEVPKDNIPIVQTEVS